MPSDEVERLKAQLRDKEREIESLRAQSEQYVALLERMPSLAWIKDSEHRLTYLNPAFEVAFGIDRQEWLHKNGSDLFTAEQAEIMAENDARVFNTPDQLQVVESITHADKTYYWLSYKYPFNLADGSRFIGGVSIDITAQVDTERDLTRSYQRQRELQSAKDRFISVLGHDLRSPIANLVVTADVLEERLTSMNVDATFVTQFRDSCERVLDLLENLIEWYHHDHANLEPQHVPVEIAPLMDDVVGVHRSHAVRKGITVQIAHEGDATPRTDPRMLETILRNLVSNAVKFAPDGSEVELRGRTASGRLQFRVTNDGKANQDALDRALEGLGDSERGTWGERGSGFGLKLAQQLTTALGGTLTATTSSGRTAFLLTLPTDPTELKTHQLVYQSQAAQAYTPGEFRELAKRLGLLAEQFGVSGIFAYADHGFCQLIEGTERAVEAYYHRIRLDDFHVNVVKLLAASSASRAVPRGQLLRCNARSGDPLPTQLSVPTSSGTPLGTLAGFLSS